MIDNNSAIPANTSFITEKKWSTFEICLGKIAIIVRSLDSNKAHGQDKISIRMKKNIRFFNFKTTGDSL